MNKILFTLIFLLPLLLFACEQEPVQEPVVSTIEKENELKNHFTQKMLQTSDILNICKEIKSQICFDRFAKLNTYLLDLSPNYYAENNSLCYLLDVDLVGYIEGNTCWKVDNNLKISPNNDNARRVELCLFKGWCFKSKYKD